MKWYELDLKTRYNEVYKKYSLVDFFYWWTDKDDPEWMEIRFDDWKIAKECSLKYYLKFNKASVFINKPIQLINIVKDFKMKSHLWFGINPKRMLRNKYGKLSFTGKDINISKLKFLFIDIDRVIKEGPATNIDLMNADFLANKILEELSKEGFNKNFIKICTANGLQLILKLDIPFNLPMPTYHEDGQIYVEDVDFKRVKDIIKKGIGKVLEKFSTKFKDEYNVEIDGTGFNLGRVGALPYSMNLKLKNKNIILPRGIVELKNEESNEGLSDYLKSLVSNTYEKSKLKRNFDTIGVVMSKDYDILKNNLSQNSLVNLMLTHHFPDGGINNTLWYSIKLLLFNKGITTNDKEYIELHEHFKILHSRSFSDNGLEPMYKNNYNGSIKKDDINLVPFMVNKYLRNHKVKNLQTEQSYYHPPIFMVSPHGKAKHEILITLNKEIFKEKRTILNFNAKYSFDESLSDPIENIKELCGILFKIRNGDYLYDTMINEDNIINDVGKLLIEQQLRQVFILFLHDFFERWGKEITIYMFKYYFNDYFNFKRFY